MYGPVAIREIYEATEGMFGQQRDDRRAWVPNYDLFFFEVLTRSGIKMLHEMRPGETGSLVVSTPILALKPPYFRCIGRDRQARILVERAHQRQPGAAAAPSGTRGWAMAEQFGKTVLQCGERSPWTEQPAARVW
jgi:hypothetical protein